MQKTSLVMAVLWKRFLNCLEQQFETTPGRDDRPPLGKAASIKELSARISLELFIRARVCILWSCDHLFVCERSVYSTGMLVVRSTWFFTIPAYAAAHVVGVFKPSRIPEDLTKLPQ